MPISVTDLPPTFTLMQVVAWIATRDPITVLRASLKEIEWRKACTALGAEPDWCDLETPGLSLFNINLLCRSSDVAGDVIRHLEHALQKGDLAASAQRPSISPGHAERRTYMSTLDWVGLRIAESRNIKNALSVRRDAEIEAIFDGIKFVEEWEDVRIEMAAVDRVWPLIRKPRYRELKEEQLRESCRPKPLGTDEPDYLSAREALSLVAFGDPQVLSHKPSDYPARWPACASFFSMWGLCIDDIKNDPQTMGTLMSRLSRMNMAEEVALRGSFLHAEREWTAKEAIVKQADATLRDIAADDRISVFGRRGKWRTRELVGLEHELILHNVYFNKKRTINRWGWLTLSDDSPAEEWAHWRKLEAPDWGDLRFPRVTLAEELHLPIPPRERPPVSPPPPASPSASDRNRRNRPGPPPVRTAAITAQMVGEYVGRPDALVAETEAGLVVAYRHVGGGREPSRDTVRKARAAALAELRQNSDRTPIIDK